MQECFFFASEAESAAGEERADKESGSLVSWIGPDIKVKHVMDSW